jgi:hypothetical protein
VHKVWEEWEKKGNKDSGQESFPPKLQRSTATRIAVKAGFRGTTERARVKDVITKGAPELIEAMDKGQIPIAGSSRVHRYETGVKWLFVDNMRS